MDTTILENENCAAIISKEQLQPAEGFPSVVFPSSHGVRETNGDGDKGGSAHIVFEYEEGGQKYVACYLDTPASQSNRIEAMLQQPAYAGIVPDVRVRYGDQEKSILEVSHRVADACVRFAKSDIDVGAAISAYDAGDIEPLSLFSPMSVLLGFWDSRASQVKGPRLIQGAVRAFRVSPARQGFSYRPSLDYTELVDHLDGKGASAKLIKAAKSQVGMNSHSEEAKLAGVAVTPDSEILRSVIVNLSLIRGFRRSSSSKVIDYIYSLAQLALTMPIRQSYRQGCLLVRREGSELRTDVRTYDGTDVSPFLVSHQEAIKEAKTAAKRLGIGGETIYFDFDSAVAADKLIEAMASQEGEDTTEKSKNGKKRSKKGS